MIFFIKNVRILLAQFKHAFFFSGFIWDVLIKFSVSESCSLLIYYIDLVKLVITLTESVKDRLISSLVSFRISTKAKPFLATDKVSEILQFRIIFCGIITGISVTIWVCGSIFKLKFLKVCSQKGWYFIGMGTCGGV